MNNVAKGNRYKYKTKKWLENQGFLVEYSEMVRFFFDRKKGVRIPIKRDLFSSDIIALRSDIILFVQVKVNKKNISSARALYTRLAVPKSCEKWIVVWIPRKRDPEVIKISS